MSSEISKALQFLSDEKGLDPAVVMEALEAALAAAYRKDFGNRQGNYTAKFNVENGDLRVWDIKTVVADISPEALEEAQAELLRRREKAEQAGKVLAPEDTADLPEFNPKTELMLTEAKAIKPDCKIGEVLEIEQAIPSDFGRMAAMTAKQVIIQKLREAERNSVFADFQGQEGKIVQGVVSRRDRGGAVVIELGKISGLMPSSEQIEREHYRPGAKIRVLLLSISSGARGPELILSRAHENMLRAIFAEEIPEVQNGDVVIRAVARDAGWRSKVAVSTDDSSIDLIGACIGQRGSRITTIIEELGGEKIDIIQWSDDASEFIKHALSPAKVNAVVLNEAEKTAIAHVSEDQFSLAIGRGGQNVRLAASLSGWKITVAQDGGEEKVVSSEDEVVE